MPERSNPNLRTRIAETNLPSLRACELASLRACEPASLRACGEHASIILFTATDPEFTATGYDFLLRMKDKQDFLRGMTSFYV